MPLSQSERSEIESLVARLTSGNLDESQRHRLADLLHEHSDAIDLYLDHCEVEAMLRETYGTLAQPTSRNDAVGSRPGIGWAPAIAAAILMAVGVGGWWARSQWFPDRAFVSQSPHDEDRGSVSQSTGPVLATITRTSGTEMRPVGGQAVFSQVGQTVQAAKYQVRGGILELSYSSGANVIVESPATIELRSDDHLLLHAGRLSVRCPTEEAKGFVVETPSGSAVDLGTEFAVDVDPNGIRDDEFHVFSGEVVIKRSADPAERAEDQESVPVKEGEALRLDRETLSPKGIDVDHQRFIRGFEAPSVGYYNRIMSLSPAVYYVMQAESEGWTLRNETSRDADATIHSLVGDHLPFAPGFNGGTSLHLDGVGCYAAVEDYPKADGDQLTVVAWVYASSRPSWASIAKNWQHGMEPERRGQFHFGLHSIAGEFRGSLEAHVNDDENVERFAVEPTPIPLNRWHHVAMVADGRVLRLYRNGKEVASTPYSGLNGNPDIKALAIGTKLDESMRPAAQNAPVKPVSASQGFWDGCIDHLAIFNTAVTAEDIRELFEIGDAARRESRPSF